MASEPKTRPTDASVDDFIAAAEPARRREEGQVLKALLEEVSGERPVMWGPSIVGYGSYKGPTGDWPVIGFSPRKAANVIYVMSGMKERPDLMERLGKHTTSGGCLYIKKIEDVDLDVLRELCSWTVQRMREKYPA